MRRPVGVQPVNEREPPKVSLFFFFSHNIIFLMSSDPHDFESGDWTLYVFMGILIVAFILIVKFDAFTWFIH